uniref:Uncharacterized protein n=1 Tax=Spongospora subterranea TaxID=70186 RepID=A0A0H5R5A8_9EUKA|eukprot:CRZ03329.1 hypothetical protein [Spongospora subterranea]
MRLGGPRPVHNNALIMETLADTKAKMESFRSSFRKTLDESRVLLGETIVHKHVSIAKEEQPNVRVASARQRRLKPLAAVRPDVKYDRAVSAGSRVSGIRQQASLQ